MNVDYAWTNTSTTVREYTVCEQLALVCHDLQLPCLR